MVLYRSVFGLLLGLIAVVLVSCGAPTETSIEPATYSPIQLERIQLYVPGVQEAREQMQKQLKFEIQNQEWQNISGFVHGPLGETLLDMNSVVRNLAPEVQQDARRVTRTLFDNLVKIDEAAQDRNAIAASKAYQAALDGFDQFFQLVPAEAQAKLAEPMPAVEPEETMEIVPDVEPQPDVEVVPPA